MEKPEQKNETQASFEDLPMHAQDAIVDLLVSIIRNQDKNAEGGDVSECK